MTRKEEAEHLSERSKQFLETAVYQVDKGFYALAIFSLEQALQLFLKMKMLENGVDYPRTHSVRALLEILSETTSQEAQSSITGLLEKYLLELGVLEDAYITTRYVMREYKREEADRLMKVVKEVMKNVT